MFWGMVRGYGKGVWLGGMVRGPLNHTGRFEASGEILMPVFEK